MLCYFTITVYFILLPDILKFGIIFFWNVIEKTVDVELSDWRELVKIASKDSPLCFAVE